MNCLSEVKIIKCTPNTDGLNVKLRIFISITEMISII